MGALSQEQIDKFWADGVLVAEDAVSAKELSELKQVFEGWVEDSCSYSEDYGETLDGRPRFDLQPGHRPDKPALRRVQSPEEVSDIFESVMRKARTVDYCADLLGPNLKFHHGIVFIYFGNRTSSCIRKCEHEILIISKIRQNFCEPLHLLNQILNEIVLTFHKMVQKS